MPERAIHVREQEKLDSTKKEKENTIPAEPVVVVVL